MSVLEDSDLLNRLRHSDAIQFGQLPIAEQCLHPGVVQRVGLSGLGELLQLGVERFLLALIVLPVTEIVLPAQQAVLVVLIGALFAFLYPLQPDLQPALLRLNTSPGTLHPLVGQLLPVLDGGNDAGEIRQYDFLHHLVGDTVLADTLTTREKILSFLQNSGVAPVENQLYDEIKRMKMGGNYASVKREIQAIFKEHQGRYGYRRITAELGNRKIHCNHKAVSRLMKELGLVCPVRMKKYRSYKGEVGRIAPNLLERNFEAEWPNEKMVTDTTEFHLLGQKLYLSILLDLYSRDIVSYTISDRPGLKMVTSMLEKAFHKIPDGTNLILHSDQGWHYQYRKYRKMLKATGIWQSMSRKGNCLYNAVVENFFGLLKSELLYLQKFASMEQFKTELVSYLEYYSNRRIKLSLGGLPPAVHGRKALGAA